MNHRISHHEQFSRAEISNVLARYRRSGLGVVQFAQEEGIPPGRLHYWIYQKGRTKVRQAVQASASKPVFQEFRVATTLPAVDSWAAEIKLPGGLSIRFSQTVAAQWIGAVVQALRGPC